MGRGRDTGDQVNDEEPSRKRQKHSSAAGPDLEKEQLREQLAQAQAQLSENALRIGFLTSKVHSVADRSKTRGNLLISLMAAVNRREAAKRAVEEAKAELEAADQALAQAIEHTTQVMSSEETPAAPAPAPAAPAEPPRPQAAPTPPAPTPPETRTADNHVAQGRPTVVLPQTLKVPL